MEESSTWVTELDRQSAADAAVEVVTRLRRAEADKLALAAHWADLHADEHGVGSGRVLPGSERRVLVGGAGTPEVGEFAAAELAVLLQCSLAAAANLMADALDLRHRLPMLWRLVDEGRVEAWKACQVARRTRSVGLSHAQCLWLDTATTPHVASRAWSAFLDLLDAKVIEADPVAAERRRQAAALERFVRTGQSNEFGLKTIVAKAAAGDVIFFVAMCDRLAQVLALEGDDDPVDVRRSKAVGILADPARALALLQRFAAVDTDDPAPCEPAPGDPDEPAPQAPADGEAARGLSGVAPRPMNVDPAKLRPAAVLYVHVSRESLLATVGTGVAAAGVARIEGVGPVTVAQVVELLGHTNVTVKPVIDLDADQPVDGYEVPQRMREQLWLRNPHSVFPWSSAPSRGLDADHTRPYVPPDDGGPPGQTTVRNLGMLERRAHRVKTHAPGWRHLQLRPGVFLWRTPSGYWFRVDHRGTEPLGKHPVLPWAPGDTPMERAFALLTLAS